jgi:protein O-GlcNAc transferase
MQWESFLHSLPTLYQNWDAPLVHPCSERFERVLQTVKGLTSVNVLQLLNHAVAHLEAGEVYCEVGSFQGATLIGALLGHAGCRAYAADNFSEFDPQGSNQQALQANLAAFNLQGQVRFHNQDYEDFLYGLRGSATKIGVYLFDGAHDYRSQLLGLLLVTPLLAERALLVIDDSNWPAVKQATWDFLRVCPAARLLLDLPTPGNCHPSFWNGLMVLVWQAGSNNGYDRSLFQGARQEELLTSLYTLQQINVRIEGDRLHVSQPRIRP